MPVARPLIPEPLLREAICVQRRSVKSIAIELGYNPRTIKRQAIAYGIPMRIVTRKQTQHNGNLPAFQDVAGPEIAYLLGFIWADGWVSEFHGRVNINILEADGEHILAILQKYCKPTFFRQPARVISKRNQKPQLCIQLADKELSCYLASLGYEDKSQIAPTKVLATIPEAYKPAFWLGYHDGDGCIDTKKYRCGYASTYKQDWGELIQLCAKLGISYRYRQYTHPTRPHSFSSITIESIARTRIFLQYLYRYLELALPRKRAQYDEFMRIPVPAAYIPPADPIIIARRERQNLLRRLRLQESRQKTDTEASSTAT